MTSIISRFKPGRWALCLALAAAAGVAASADAPAQAPKPDAIAAEAPSPRLFVDGGVAARLDGVPGSLTLAITAAAGEAPARLALDAAITDVRSVRRAGDRLIVLGDLGVGGATEVSLVALRTGAVLDRFWAIAPAPSPDGRLIAFVRLHPMRFTAGPESQYRVYRLSLDAAGNRTEFGGAMAGEAGPSPMQDVGFAVYPSYDGAWPPDNVDVPAAVAHRQASRLVWSTDSRSLAFVDTHGGRAQTVLVQFDADGQVREVLAAPMGGLCVAGATADGCRPTDTDLVHLDIDAGQQAVRVSLLDKDPSSPPRRVVDLTSADFKRAN